MQNRPRIGELLGEMIPLSGHDVEEILSEQHTSARRFGEIALSWGLCRPEHVWSARHRQVQDADGEIVDLDRDGIDAQAVALLPAELAQAFRAIAIRAGECEIVVASDAQLSERARAALQDRLKKHVKFVIAPRKQIDAAIDVYYSA